MKITIDTKEDSHEDMRKVIALLSSIIGENEKHSNIFEDSSPGLENKEEPSGNAFANMFGNSGEKKTDDGFVELSDMDKKDEDKEDSEEAPEIMTY